MSEWFVVGVALPLLIVLAVNFVCLYRFRRNARPWALALTALCLVLNTLMQPTVEVGLATMITETSITLWGAILAMMYCEPYSRLFEETSVAKVTSALVLDSTNPYQPPIT